MRRADTDVVGTDIYADLNREATAKTDGLGHRAGVERRPLD